MDPSEVKQIMEELTTKMMAMVDTHYGRVIAKLDARLGEVKACEGTTKVFLEKKGSAPEEPDSVAEPKEVPESAMEQETGQDAEDQTGELRLAVRRHRQRRKRAEENSGPRQKFAAFRGRVTRRPIPALIKGHVRKGPRRNRHSDIRGPGKASGSRMEDGDLKQQRIKDNVVRGAHKERTRPVFENGMRNQGTRKSILRTNGRRVYEAFQHKFETKAVKTAVVSPIGPQEPGDWLLWKCRPPPKRKR
jgi:hypothetical protein